MRHVWIDLNQPIEPAKLHANGITRTYGDMRNPSFSGDFEDGIYGVQSWENLGPGNFAKALSAAVAKWGGDTRFMAVHANIELHDANYIVKFLGAWRYLRPIRETVLVIEGNQAGWFTPELVRRINADANLTVMAEAYTGSMAPMNEDEVRSNLVNYGIRREKALVMYDAAHLHSYWDGCAFTQQRLP